MTPPLRVAVLGTGLMGSAMVRTWKAKNVDFEVVLWNRTTSKARKLSEETGYRYVIDVVDALKEADVILLCITASYDQEYSWSLLSQVETLERKVIVETSSSEPFTAAAHAEKVISQKRCTYLQCAMLAAPPMVGTPACVYLVSGDRSALARATPVLHPLCQLVDVGSDHGVACAYDIAVVGEFLFGVYGSVVGAAILRAYPGASLETLQTFLVPLRAMYGGVFNFYGQYLAANDPQREAVESAPLSSSTTSIGLWHLCCTKLGLDCDPFEPFVELIRRVPEDQQLTNGISLLARYMGKEHRPG